MHRDPLLKLLAEYRMRYSIEQPCIDRFEQFVRSQTQCFERSLKVGHVTGSAWLVDQVGEKVLLTHHRKLNIWLQFGGHADGQADVKQVALREATEESGLQNIQVLDASLFDLDIHTIPARGDEPSHEHFDGRFVMQITSDQPYVVSDESHDLAWVSLSALEQYTVEPTMLRMRDKWLAYQFA